jgi:hypothetical protein
LVAARFEEFLSLWWQFGRISFSELRKFPFNLVLQGFEELLPQSSEDFLLAGLRELMLTLALKSSVMYRNPQA